MPPVFSGVVLGALFIAVVGTGAGLALRIAIVVKNDILPVIKHCTKEKICKNIAEKKLIIIFLFYQWDH